jgi:hypothetical protein
MLILADLKADLGIRRVASYCPDSADFIDLVNSAIRRAMRRGDFVGTLQPIYMCLRAGCVVWPRYVQNVRAISACGSTYEPKNMWGGFLPRGRGAPWRMGLKWWSGRDCERIMISQGRTSVFQDIQGEGRLVRAYARCNNDYGKKITIFGTDNSGQPLQTKDVSTGQWSMGLVLVLGNPFVSTSTYVRSIDYVILDEMQCPVNLFAYNAATNLLEDLAQYDPGETRPSFERTRISMPTLMPASCAPGSCCSKSAITALVKLRFMPVKYDNDLVYIDNIDAIKMLIQSVKAGENSDQAGANGFLVDAINELNRQIEDENPDSQFVAENEIFGGATFSNSCF